MTVQHIRTANLRHSHLTLAVSKRSLSMALFAMYPPTRAISAAFIRRKSAAPTLILGRGGRLLLGAATPAKFRRIGIERFAGSDYRRDDLARRLPCGVDRARALAASSDGLHSGVNYGLGGRKARVGRILLGRVLQERIC